MISRSTLVGALVVVELAIVGLALSAFSGLRATTPAWGSSAFQFGPPAVHPPALDRTFVTGPAPRVVVDVRDVDVRVDTHAAPTVVASEALQIAGYMSGTVPAIQADASGPSVRITMAGNGPHFVLGDVSRTLRLAVPEGSAIEIVSAGRIDASGLRAKLVAHTPDGSVHVRDHRGDLDLSSSDGNIELVDVQGADLAFNTHDGRLYLTRVAGDRIDGHTNHGRIYAVDVTAHDGALSTHFGRISASFTGQSDATVAVSTRTEHVSVSGLPSGQLSERARSVQLGAGRGRFEVSTDDGAVNISEGASS